MGIVIGLVIIIVVIAMVAYGIISKRKREQAMADLATHKGWTALANNSMTLGQYLPQYLQQLGQQSYGFGGNYTRINTNYDMAYQATVTNHRLVLFQFEYTEYHHSVDPQQPEQSETHFFTVLNVDMPVPEPTIMLLHHSFVSKLANFGLHSGLQKINLEGDFNHYYDTYIAPNDQINALSLLTPDVMELITAMAGTKTHASIQMAGQKMIISFENQLLTPEFIQPLLTQVATLLAKLDAKPQVALQSGALPKM